MYGSLIIATAILLVGVMCYFLQKYEINETNVLYKYRPSKNNILIKLHLFKYNKRFNYFLLIPYLISWFIFIAIFMLYIVYWLGVKKLDILFLGQILNTSLALFLVLLFIYTVLIQHIIESSIRPDFSMDKDTKDEKDKNDQ